MSNFYGKLLIIKRRLIPWNAGDGIIQIGVADSGVSDDELFVNNSSPKELNVIAKVKTVQQVKPFVTDLETLKPKVKAMVLLE